MGSGHYVYGVVESDSGPLDLSVEGVHGATEFYTVEHRTLAAVVSDIDTTEPEETDEDAQAHDDVLQAVLQSGRTVAPMRFGMVFESKRALKNVLRGARPAFTRSLREVEGRVELGVKLVAPEDADLDREAIVEDVSERLCEVSLAESENDLFSDRLVLNRSYLVERDEQEAFSAAVDEVEAEYPDLTVRYTGPWAPYNFVDIHVGAQR